MRKNDRKPGDVFTACKCEKCGELYEADRKHICRLENSYPINSFSYEQEEREAIQGEPRPIDANALLKKLEPYKGWQFHEAIDAAIEAVKQAPTLDLSFTGYGRWIKPFNGKGHRWVCSECGKNVFCVPEEPQQGYCQYRYCPYCGAQMEDDEEESKERKAEG